MIQYHNPHRKPLSRTTQACHSWGSPHGQKHYSLEVIQNPIRARQCGFGDKDRRPLAPAAVAKLIVRREDGSLVDVDDIDTSFFVAAADLWDETGQYEMNLVLHPSSDRNNPSKPSSKHKLNPTSHSRVPIQTSLPTAQDTPPPTASSPQVLPVIPIPEDKPILQQYQNFVTETGQPTWGYGPSVPMAYPLPSSATSLTTSSQSSELPCPPDQIPYSTWNTNPSSTFDPTPIDPAVVASNSIGPSENSLGDTWSGAPSQTPSLAPQTQIVTETTQSSADSPLITSVKPFTHPRKKHNPLNQSPLSQKDSATYTRTLMGPLSSPAYRLLDQHRQPGIFFLFQDLSIRTEGTFRLRLRLMNVGAPPAPEAGSTRVTDSLSPILAQTFTSPFTIYSAKRFPGVPDTTALSIAFGNQGMKIPLRNRHGKRQRGASDDDSS